MNYSMSGGKTPIQIVLLASLAVGCANDAQNDGSVAKSLIDRFDTTASASSTMGLVSDLAVAPDGTLWLADRANSNLVSIKPGNGQHYTFSRRGSGPGEMLRPEAISVSDSTVIVVDAGNSRVQFFRHDGTPSRQVSLNRSVITPIALNSRGDLAALTMGHDSSLAVILADSARSIRKIGTPVVPPPSMINLRGLQQQAMSGEIPLEFRNNVFPVLDESGSAWLVLQAEGTVQHFDRNGQLQWSVALPDSVVSAARSDYLAKAAAETNPARVPMPRVITGARLHAGELWLMLSPGANRKNWLLVLDAETGVTQRHVELNLTAAGLFAIDGTRNLIHIIMPDDGMIVTGRLERD